MTCSLPVDFSPPNQPLHPTLTPPLHLPLLWAVKKLGITFASWLRSLEDRRKEKKRKYEFVDPAAAGIDRALAVGVQNPKLGALMLLDRLADRLDLERPRRAALLSRAAKEALAESFPSNRA